MTPAFTGFGPSGLPQCETVSTGTNPAEVQAVPLLYSWNHAGSSNGAPCIGEHSVRWIAPLHRFLLTYGSAECGGLYYRTATAPWGPWSAETRFFPNNPGYGTPAGSAFKHTSCHFAGLGGELV